MAMTPVDVKQAAGRAPAPLPDVFQTFRSELDRLFDQFGWFGAPWLPRRPAISPGFTRGPAVEVAEDDRAWTLTAELPGLSEADMEVALSGDVLTLRGEKKQAHEEKGKDFYVSERSYGSFARSFTVPDGVDRDAIAASFARGVLTVTLPKRADAKPAETRIEVKPAG